ncbi:hypothetical protein [Parahaliea aestuarii]|uniref:Glycosyltransferase RgtA/B/C/D-like domain-containing protein n=1 Tax=Parahaliea aestuarii TaxID=1852021 RepID=A0A5C9A0N0_9GAMM|nr:hypothetical protein [Parahaliea aestuarii]TXS94425.1 hypothetical protein FVW59_00445 [Parahaliea aestuarii]
MTESGRPSWQSACWYLVGALLFLGFGFTEMAGSDLWWHLAGGREILEQGTLWLRDTWSYSAAGERWRNHEWLSDLVFYGWYQLFGLHSLVYWKWLLVIACFGLLQALLVRLSGAQPAALLLSVLALAVAAPFIDMRPHLYSLLAFVVLLHLGVRRAPFWQFALLFLLWVNLHGGFMLGLLVLPFLLFPFRQSSWAAVWRVALWELGCIAVCMLNPDGAKVVIYPLTYALQAESPFRQIAEWLPPWMPGGIQSPLFFWCLPLLPLALLGYCLPLLRRQVHLPWWSLGVALLTLAMALTSRRFIPLFAIALAVFAAPLLGVLLGRLRAGLQWTLLGALLLVALLRLAPYPLQAAPAFHYLTAEYSYPHLTVDVLQRNRVQGRVFAYYNWGGFLHWRSDGALSVYIDGRANTLYGDAVYLNYVSVLRGDPGWIDIVEQSGAEYFLWPARLAGGAHKAKELLASGRWKRVYSSSSAILLARQEVPVQLSVGVPADSPWWQLSEGWRFLLQGDADRAQRNARAVLEKYSYHQGACNLLGATLREVGDEAGAARNLADCRAQFPSVFLR